MFTCGTVCCFAVLDITDLMMIRWCRLKIAATPGEKGLVECMADKGKMLNAGNRTGVGH